MTWPGAALYVCWIGLIVAYFFTRNDIVFFASMAGFVAVLLWRFIPGKSRSCELPQPPVPAEHRGSTSIPPAR